MSEQVPLNALRVFEAVARLGSFTRAAEELFITQSAVSHQVKALEDWMGEALFDRTRRLPKLLPKAQALAQVLASAFRDIDSACRRLRASDTDKQLVVAVIPSVATCWLIPRLAEFRGQHPDIGFRIVYAIHGHEPDDEGVDLTIVYAAEKRLGANITPFLDGTAAPVCSTSFAARYESTANAQTIARMPLLHDTDFSGWRQWCRKAGVTTPDLEQSLVFEDFNLLRAATLAGQGISLCPLKLIEDDLQSGRLVQLSDTTVSEHSGYYIRQSITAPTVERQRFLDWLLATASAT
jgi:LysR family transcriptional regulator, glycine cleavage system transcriptional activator